MSKHKQRGHIEADYEPLSNVKLAIAGLVIGGAGVALLIMTLGWLPTLGIFVLIYGNNLGQSINRTTK